MAYYGLQLPYQKLTVREQIEDHLSNLKSIEQYAYDQGFHELGINQTEAVRSLLKEHENDECICQGNWRTIAEEIDSLIGSHFVDKDDKVWQLFGLVHTNEDYYYGIQDNDGKARLLSCVGSLETWGLEPIKQDLKGWHTEAITEGRLAYLNGFDKDDPSANPYIKYGRTHWMYRSFVAGWEEVKDSGRLPNTQISRVAIP